MLSEVMAHYGLAQPFYDAGWFETEHHRQVARTLAWAVAHRLSNSFQPWVLARSWCSDWENQARQRT